MEEHFDIEQRVNQRLQQKISFDFDRFFGNGWDIYKKVALMIAGAVFLMVIPILIVYMVMMPFLLGISSFEQYMDIVKDNPYYFQQMQRSPMYILKQSLLTVIVALISAPIQGGMMQLCRDADKGKELRFGTIFSFYKAPYFGKLVLAVLIQTVVSSVLNVSFSFIPVVGNLLYLAVIFVGYIMISYVQQLIVFGNAGVGQAYSLSFKLGSKTFIYVLAYALLFGLLACVGAIACCIGIFFTVAFMPTCSYLLYKYAVGFPEDEVVNDEPGNWQQQPPSI